MKIKKKIAIDFYLFCSIILIGPFLLGFSQNLSVQSPEGISSVNSDIKSILNKMIYIQGDTFTMGQTSAFDLKMNASDSTLFSAGIPKRTIVNPYYISATEVTNREWREYYEDKVMELGQASAKSNFYPDTSLWTTEFPYSYNAPMAKHYFANPSFDDYPVVGITWDQANDYCLWISNKLNSLLVKKGIRSSAEFRLPSEGEWEYAAIRKKVETKYTKWSVYVWSEENGLGQINDLANIGQIHDINNVVLKEYADDGSLYTSRVGSYPPNQKGIYDMAGNVSEWTTDDGYSWSIGFPNHKLVQLKTVSEVEKEIALLNSKSSGNDQEMKRYEEQLTHDRNVLRPKDVKICKGGSWANGMIYTQIGSRQGKNKDNASTKIGFRIAISNVSPDVASYFPEKKWKPGKKSKR